MGQKINPTCFRLAVRRKWASRWYAGAADFARMLNEDIGVRAYLRKKLKSASVGRVLIERPSKNARITIFSARPGVVIGKKGEDIEVLKSDLQRLLKIPVHVNIEEIRKPETDAQLIADSITQQIEKRINPRRAMKRAMQNAMRLGAQGVKIECSGRLNGVEIARREWHREGRVPLHTLRAEIDYATSEALTTYGKIGVKVWVYKGDMLAKGEVAQAEKESAQPADREDRRPRRPAPGGRPGPSDRRGPARGRAGETEPRLAAPAGEAQRGSVKRVRKPSTEAAPAVAGTVGHGE